MHLQLRGCRLRRRNGRHGRRARERRRVGLPRRGAAGDRPGHPDNRGLDLDG